jgi:DNA-binding transcriptional LysR family regulator
MNLSIQQLQSFRAVMRTGSISEAARSLNRTQPAVTTRIANLETELGFALFERRGGRLVPTPEAHYFLEEAEIVLERLSLSARTMTEISNLERGRLRITCLPAAASFLMPRIVAEFVRDRPDVTVSLMSRSSLVVADWIASQQYDVGLAETPAPRAAFTLQTFELDCVCAMRRDDPLAAKPVITPLDLDDTPMAALYPDHATNRLTRSAFAGMGARFRQRFELQTFLPALELVGHGLCRCICDPITAGTGRLREGGPGDLVIRPLSPRIPYPISILTPAHRPASLLARAFVDHLAEALRQFGHLDDREIP